jgi:hypothetical protein
VLACHGLTDCQEACGYEHDAGVAVFRSFDADFRGTCRAQCGFGQNWSCVGNITPPKARASETKIESFVRDYLTNVPIAGAEVSVCLTANPTCDTPITAPQITDAQGRTTLKLPPVTVGEKPHDVFLRVRPGTTTLIESHRYFGQPVSEAVMTWTSGVITEKEFADVEALVALEGVTVDRKLGMLTVTVDDCLHNDSSDAVVTSNVDDVPGVVKRYLRGPPNQAATSTDASGSLFYVNVPIGPVDVTATPSSVGKVTSRKSVLVKPGVIVSLVMIPTE